MSKTIVSKWVGLQESFQEDIVEQKRDIREREAAILYHQEMLVIAREKLTALEIADKIAMGKQAGDEER